MVYEIKDGPTGVYHKMSSSGQRTDVRRPLCTNTISDPDLTIKICKGEIYNMRCSKCYTWYGEGPDPGIGNEEPEKRKADVPPYRKENA